MFPAFPVHTHIITITRSNTPDPVPYPQDAKPRFTYKQSFAKSLQFTLELSIETHPMVEEHCDA